MISRKYTLRYGDAPGIELVTSFNEDDTIRENLERIIPFALDKGLLGPDCTAENIRLVFKDKVLNSHIPLEEQANGIAEYDLLVVEDITNVIPIRIRYKPDHFEEQSETIDVDPDLSLEGQLKNFLESIRKKYRFRGLHRKRYRMYDHEIPLDLRKPLRAQGVTSALEIRLEPRTWVGWPPKIFEYLALVLILLGIVWFVHYLIHRNDIKPVESFHVTFTSDADSYVYLNGEQLVLLEGQKPATRTLAPGIHELVIKAREHPIFVDTLDISNTLVPIDSVIHEIGVKAFWGKKCSNTDLKIMGYFDTAKLQNRIYNRLFVNGFPYPVLEAGENIGTVLLNIPLGVSDQDLYEIGFELDKDLFIRVAKSDNVYYSRFMFGFSAYEGEESALLVFFYERPEEQDHD